MWERSKRHPISGGRNKRKFGRGIFVFSRIAEVVLNLGGRRWCEKLEKKAFVLL
jgi:hypothetical protein